jgi:hypothetical protein
VIALRKWKKCPQLEGFAQIEVIPSGFINLTAVNFSNNLSGLIHQRIAL